MTLKRPDNVPPPDSDYPDMEDWLYRLGNFMIGFGSVVILALIMYGMLK